MGKIWTYNRRDLKDLSRLRRGDIVYTITDQSGGLEFEDAQLVERWECTVSNPLLGGAMFGPMGADQLLATRGTVYEQHPSGIRGTWEATPQVDGPLSGEDPFGRPLDDAEIRGLRKRVRDAQDARRDRRKAS